MFPQGPQLSSLLRESGYFHIQATKPDTIGVALQNNPVGLAAYILEKFSTGSNKAHLQEKDGGLDKTYSMDVIIDNLMVYYISGCMTTAVRIYKENLNPQTMGMSRVATNVPIGAAFFRHEFYPQFPFLLEEKFKNIIHVAYFDVGGHFASIEQPELLYKDIATFVFKSSE
jgi:juvenile hormone epoxide hydrolase